MRLPAGAVVATPADADRGRPNGAQIAMRRSGALGPARSAAVSDGRRAADQDRHTRRPGKLGGVAVGEHFYFRPVGGGWSPIRRLPVAREDCPAFIAAVHKQHGAPATDTTDTTERPDTGRGPMLGAGRCWARRPGTRCRPGDDDFGGLPCGPSRTRMSVRARFGQWPRAPDPGRVEAGRSPRLRLGGTLPGEADDSVRPLDPRRRADAWHDRAVRRGAAA